MPDTATLTRDRIVDEAINLLDDEGGRALSMRKLAGRLDCGTMSIYHYVPDKAALVEAIAEQLMNELEQPAEQAPWDESVRTMSWSFRDLTHRHPAAFQLLLSGPRPAALARTAEGVVDRLIAAGFSADDAQTAFRSIIRYLLGTLVVEHDARATADDLAETFSAGLDIMISGVSTLR